MTQYVVIGDVIYLDKDDCKLLGCLMGEYVVENAKDSGGWTVWARQLDASGRYCANNPIVRFQQCSGYKSSLPTIKVVRHMTRTFI